MREKILRGRYSFREVHRLIKSLEYYNTSVRGEPVFMDLYFNQVPEKDAFYRLDIAYTPEGKWKIDYYHQDKLAYKGEYSDIYPFIKDGEFTSYYPDGKLREARIYQAGRLWRNQRFYENGQLNYEKVIKEKSGRNRDVGRYYKWYDRQGNDLLKDNTDAVIPVRDNITGRTVNFVIKDRAVVYTYYEDLGERIYQPVDRHIYEFQDVPFKKRFMNYTSELALKHAYYNGVTGYTLIRFRIDKRGELIDYKPLNSLSPALTLAINDILGYSIHKKREDEIKPLRMDGKKVEFELVVPIYFGIKKYFNKNPYYMWLSN